METTAAEKLPVVDMECCILCEVCADLAPHAFAINDAGYVDVAHLDDYSDDDIHQAVVNCPRGCIVWE